MTHDDFTRFFHALNNYDPFPWQLRLAESVTRNRTWPGVIALPTAAGKTAILDVAIFALALDADLAAADRCASRRIFFVVDRRIIVDEVLGRSNRIAGALNKARNDAGGILHEVADRLMTLGGSTPLQVSAMRGGMYRDNAWTRSPVQPTVCVSTVDQVGSRLLFRGYGLNNGVLNPLPIHAGLIANDALLILDEAHLSQPFAETLDAIKRYREWAEFSARAPWHFVQMSATPREDRDTFATGDDDLTHPGLGPRLNAHKRAALIQVKCEAATERDSRQRKRELEAANANVLVEEVCEQARALRGGTPPTGVVAVILNRVASARTAFQRLRTEPQAEAILLTGRGRPYDRDRLIESWKSRLEAGRSRDEGKGLLFVVATQCIEVGANFDFDALVTECAALDALRQRFGRVDRLGTLGESHASIIARTDQIRAADDVVYGAALAETWKWLGKITPGKSKGRKHTVDFGTVPLAKAVETAPAEVFSPSKHAPVALPAHLDLWAQTSPIPVPDPDISLFLHGPEAQLADVQVVWRADIDLSVADPKLVSDIVRILPPSSMEAMPVPFAAARAWLCSVPDVEIADVEGMRSESRDENREGRCAFRWRSIENSEIITPQELRPGDTIVVPAAYGGADEFGWNPASTQPVRDIADMVAVRRSIPILRLHRHVLESLLLSVPREPGGSVLTTLGQLLNAAESDEADKTELLTALLQNLVDLDGVPEEVRISARLLAHDARRRVILYPDDSGIAVTGSSIARDRLRSGRELGQDLEDEFTDEDDASVMIRREITLRDHSNGVKSLTERFAAASGLSLELAEDLELAAWLHDLGKADPRFQLMLHGGDEFKLIAASELLAKSAMDPRDPASRRARKISCYPDGGRHECQSVALIAANAAVLERAHDRDLVLHLVGSHHGCGRPFMPVVFDKNPEDVKVRLGDVELRSRSDHRLERLDSGVSDRFWRLTRRYGWYGLAYLESILRLADHRCSEAEQAYE